MTRVLVIGGGIAGLTAAYTLSELGRDVTLVEAEPRFGGKLWTEHVDDLLIDAGPDSFLSSKPAALQLIDKLGLSERVVNTRPDGGGTFILHAGRLHPLPEGITLLVPADIRNIARTSLLSPLGKLRMMLDYVIPARRDTGDESVGAFVRRRVGREAFERLAEPLLSGIYAGDADHLSVLATFPRFREIEQRHGGLIRVALAQRRQRATAPPIAHNTPFVSLANGLGELVEALVAALAHHDLRAGIRVESLESAAGSYTAHLSDGSHVRANVVLLAVPAFAAANLLLAMAPALASELRQIPYVSTATVSLAYRAEEVAAQQCGRGFVVPRSEGRALTAVTWTSNKFADRAPDDVALLRCFVGRAGSEQSAALPEDKLVALVRTELRGILDIHATPLRTRVYRWPHALAQYTLGHPDRLARIDALTSQLPGMALIGSAYRGVGIPDVIRDATERATELAGTLEHLPALSTIQS
jgi:oxygen-dependent protoporphyrinogen oxidase